VGATATDGAKKFEAVFSAFSKTPPDRPVTVLVAERRMNRPFVKFSNVTGARSDGVPRRAFQARGNARWTADLTSSKGPEEQRPLRSGVF
jgi:hypothetical protein